MDKHKNTKTNNAWILNFTNNQMRCKVKYATTHLEWLKLKIISDTIQCGKGYGQKGTLYHSEILQPSVLKGNLAVSAES